jgi:hypothetical protein
MDTLTTRQILIGLGTAMITALAVSAVLNFVFHLDSSVANGAGSFIGILLGLTITNRMKCE